MVFIILVGPGQNNSFTSLSHSLQGKFEWFCHVFWCNDFGILKVANYPNTVTVGNHEMDLIDW